MTVIVGQTISHYKVTAELGRGGMGVVYKAEDTSLDRPVALKFLAAHLVEDTEIRKRFEREAKAAAALNHPNVCTVHEIAEANGRTYIAMAFLEGEPLEKKIEAGPLKLKDALDFAIQTAHGLEAAHEKKIVHRDIKPANLMITGAGSKQLVTIMDFGLALLADRSKLTRLDETMGTVISSGVVRERTSHFPLAGFGPRQPAEADYSRLVRVSAALLAAPVAAAFHPHPLLRLPRSPQARCLVAAVPPAHCSRQAVSHDLPWRRRTRSQRLGLPALRRSDAGRRTLQRR